MRMDSKTPFIIYKALTGLNFEDFYRQTLEELIKRWKHKESELKLAGLSLGMTDGQILRYIELPLARATILAGVRIATVIAIGVATIEAVCGRTSWAKP